MTAVWSSTPPVSYTHLDVYKRQVTAHLGRAACRVTLDDEDLGAGGVFFTAVGQLAGHPAGLQRSLAAHQLPCLFGGGAGAGCLLSLIHIVAQPPLFKVQKGNTIKYAYNDAEMAVLSQEMPGAKVNRCLLYTSRCV